MAAELIADPREQATQDNQPTPEKAQNHRGVVGQVNAENIVVVDQPWARWHCRKAALIIVSACELDRCSPVL